MTDVIRRMRLEFDLDDASLLKMTKESPRCLRTRRNHWRKANELEYRVIDDKLLYFGREPQNLFLFSADAKARLPEKKTTDDWKLIDHLSRS